MGYSKAPDEHLSDAEQLQMPPVILGTAEWSTKQRMLSLFWNAAQPSIRTTMTFNYPWLRRRGVYLLYISMVMIIYAIINQRQRNQV